MADVNDTTCYPHLILSSLVFWFTVGVISIVILMLLINFARWVSQKLFLGINLYLLMLAGSDVSLIFWLYYMNRKQRN